MAHAITSGNELYYRTALDRAAYALFQIKRMSGVPQHVIDHVREAHQIACAALDEAPATPVPSEGRTPDAWMNAAGLVSSFQGGGYDMPLYRHAPSATAPAVPTEPTPEMLLAADKELYGRYPHPVSPEWYRVIWKAMLAAAPIDSRKDFGDKMREKGYAEVPPTPTRRTR